MQTERRGIVEALIDEYIPSTKSSAGNALYLYPSVTVAWAPSNPSFPAHFARETRTRLLIGNCCRALRPSLNTRPRERSEQSNCQATSAHPIGNHDKSSQRKQANTTHETERASEKTSETDWRLGDYGGTRPRTEWQDIGSNVSVEFTIRPYGRSLSRYNFKGR